VAAAIVALLVLFAIIGSQSGNNDSNGGTSATTTSKQDQAAARKRARKRAKAREKARREKRRRDAARQVTRLKIVPTGTVFVCVVDAQGKPVVAGQNLDVGGNTPELRSKSFKILLGNGAATLRVNGKDVPVPDRATAVAYSVTAGRAREIPAAQGPSCG
jgi:hypothetical protein